MARTIDKSPPFISAGRGFSNCDWGGDRGCGRGSGNDFYNQHQQQQTNSIGSTPNNERPQCQACNKYDHKTLQCYNMYNKAYQLPSTPIAKLTYLDNPSTSEWYLDFEATHHIIGDLNLLVR